MKAYILYALFGFTFSLILTVAILPLLKKLKAGQYILGYVKEHLNKKGTPTMGGLAFIVAIVGVCFVCYGFGNKVVNLTLIITVGFALVGFLDDFLKIYKRENEGLKPYQKICFQLSIAVIAAVFCFVNDITALIIPFCGGLFVNIGWGIIPLVIFVFIATVNCVNLTDGLDGLAGGVSLVYFAVMGVLLALSNNVLGGVCFVAVGALVAFLAFNVNRAVVFMGDTGSLALGGLIACVTVFSGNTLSLPILGIAFVMSGISVIVQVIYYKKTSKRIFLMAPFHHHLQMKGLSECKISYLYAMVTAVCGCLLLLFS